MAKEKLDIKGENVKTFGVGTGPAPGHVNVSTLPIINSEKKETNQKTIIDTGPIGIRSSNG